MFKNNLLSTEWWTTWKDAFTNAAVEMTKYVHAHKPTGNFVLFPDEDVEPEKASSPRRGLGMGFIWMAIDGVPLKDWGHANEPGEKTEFRIRVINDEHAPLAKFTAVDELHLEIKVQLPDGDDVGSDAYAVAFRHFSNPATRTEIGRRAGVQVESW